ncbi:serine protease [Cordyceps militaris]|uniref:Serine protease n=1 Tax=Cordyceps militaris TaxID=73501 RepID=A0A2H4SRH7_CORMI|nr:serine protease [Cordyceps militaris]
MRYLVAAVLAAVTVSASNLSPHGGRPATDKVYDRRYCYGLYPQGTPCPITAGTFDQLIDHDDPSLGTFKQRYWANPEFYAGPGAPIVLSGPGEAAADPYVWYTTNYTLDGVFAQEIKGASIVLEHRYWGESSPFDKMTTKNMRYLTLDNAMRDTIYFARNVKLPFDPAQSSHPDRAPWVFTGGSYPGALAAWIEKLYPGTFWAYHAVSGVVQPIADYWQYYVPIEAAMPRNCSRDMKLAIRHIDRRLGSSDAAGKEALKAKFGLAGLEDDDFGWALTDGLQSWQGTQFNTGPGNIPLYEMCDYIEGVGGGGAANATTTPVPDEHGVGACAAAAGLARWFREVRVPGNCARNWSDYWKGDNATVACWDTHNSTSPYFTDRSLRNKWNLQWQWMSCNEPFQQWQGSYPGDTGLVSRYATVQSLRDQCERFFPDEDGYSYGLKRGRTTDAIVELTGGWGHVNSTRLVQVNGEYDPWLPETVSSPFRPGGPLQSTPEVPTFVVPKAAHCPDLVMSNTRANDALHDITQEVIAIIVAWVGEFYEEKGIPQPGV